MFAAVLGVIGLAYLAPGVWLAVLGGTAYYALAGALVMASAVLLWRGRVAGVWAYAVLLAGTIVWALAESGLDGWALAPRLFGPALFGLFMVLPGFRRRLAQGGQPVRRASGVTGLLSLVALALIAFGLVPAASPGLAPLGPLPGVQSVLAANPAAADWPTFGNDAGNTRFSPLTQITRDNVALLEPAWTFHVGKPAIKAIVGMEVTPLKVGDAVYLCSGNDDIIKLDAETGRQVWRHAAHNDMTGLYATNCRGVVYYQRPDARPGAACARRIIAGTSDGRVLAVDAADGRSCGDFGTAGVIDAKQGMGDVMPGYFSINSPPQIIGGRLVIGGQIEDGQSTDEPSAAIRAFDAATGKFIWAWDIGRPGVHGAPAPGGQYTRGEPNSWAPMAADPALNLIFAPMGNATPDYYGGQRTAAMDRYSSAIVAIDATTGAPRWTFQTTHHDLWDYDLASPPTLVDVPGPAGSTIPALIQPTKRGELFMLDRRTGKPLAEVAERPVPVSMAVGEHSSPTQPFSVGMPSFAGPAPSEQRMWGISPFDQMWCRIRFRQARFAGTMTPVEADRPTITWPGFLGGMEWGGVSVDPLRHILIVNTNQVPNYNRLIPRRQADAMGVRPFARGEAGYVGGPVAQMGTPYAVAVQPFLSPIGVPCTQPPFGMISGVDLATHQLLWSHPFGTGRAAGPLGIRSHLPLAMGVPNIGGAVVTGAGLAFIGAAQDGYLRAYDLASGRELWRTDLPAGGNATPITYWSSRSGRQFVVIAAGGHGGILSRTGDSVVAYALPRK